MAEELDLLFILKYDNFIREGEGGNKTELSPKHVPSAVSLYKGCHCVLHLLRRI